MADAAAPAETLFEKIAAKKIPSVAVYEDELAYAFRDINPTAPVHILIVPKKCGNLTGLSTATEADKPILGHLMYVASVVAKREGLEKGFRIVVNDGENGLQSVAHLHLHLIGGKKLTWPPGTGLAEGSMHG